jgi:F-type H+-transporting ATPase subunit b
MQFAPMLAAQDGGVVEGLKQTAQDVGLKFGFDKSLFLSQLIGFFIVAFLLHRFAFKPLQTLLAERQKRIADSLEAAERMKADLAKADEERKRVLLEAGQQATKIIEEARAAAASLSEQERQKAVADAQNILTKAREAGEAELSRLKGELRKEFGRLVVQAAARSTGDVLTADQKNRLADDAVRQLSA